MATVVQAISPLWVLQYQITSVVLLAYIHLACESHDHMYRIKAYSETAQVSRYLYNNPYSDKHNI